MYFFLTAFGSLLLRVGSLQLQRVGALCCGARASSCSGDSLQVVWVLVVVVPGLSCSAARGFFLDRGLNPCPLHWQVDS